MLCAFGLFECVCRPSGWWLAFHVLYIQIYVSYEYIEKLWRCARHANAIAVFGRYRIYISMAAVVAVAALLLAFAQHHSQTHTLACSYRYISHALPSRCIRHSVCVVAVCTGLAQIEISHRLAILSVCAYV